MDRVYKQDIPNVVKTLDELRSRFALLDSKTDWASLRIDPLLQHATTLERILGSKRFARETAHLRTGVGMFHADPVYFRENIRGLKGILAAEEGAASRRR